MPLHRDLNIAPPPQPSPHAGRETQFLPRVRGRLGGGHVEKPTQRHLLASVQLWSVEPPIYLPLLALGWARCGQASRAAETLRALVGDEEVQREVGVSFAARCIAERGSSQVVIAAAPTAEQLRGARLENQYTWVSALLAVAETLLDIPPYLDAETIPYRMFGSFFVQLTGVEAFDPYNLTLPLFTGEMPETNEHDAG